MTIAKLCHSLGLSPRIQEEAEARLKSLGVNLNSRNDVLSAINSLLGSVRPFIGMAMPLLRKVSPGLKSATGYDADELYSALRGVTEGRQDRHGAQTPGADLYGKYKNL